MGKPIRHVIDEEAFVVEWPASHPPVVARGVSRSFQTWRVIGGKPRMVGTTIEASEENRDEMLERAKGQRNMAPARAPLL